MRPLLLLALAAPARAGLPLERCSLQLDSISRESGASGDEFELRGKFGPPAPFKVAVVNRGNSTALEVLDWKDAVLRVRLAPKTPLGEGAVGVYCFWGRYNLGSGFKRFEVVPPGPTEPGAFKALVLPAAPIPAELARRDRADALIGQAQGLWMTQGPYPQGLLAIEEAIALYHAADDPSGEAHAQLMRYYFLHHSGREEEGYKALGASERLFRAALRDLPKGDERRFLEADFHSTLVWLAEAKRRRRLFDEARALVAELQDFFASSGWSGSQAVSEGLLGDLDSDQGRFAEAAFHYDAAMSHYKRAGNKAGVERYRSEASRARDDARRYAETRAKYGNVESTAPAAAPLPEPPAPFRALHGFPTDAVGALAVLRFAITVYVADRGAPPPSLESLRELGLVGTLPRLSLPDHPSHTLATSLAGVSEQLPKGLKDTGGWGYDPKTGAVFIDCTHRDDRGPFWAR